MLGSNSKTKHVGELRKLCKRQNDLQEGRELVYDGDAIFEGIGPDTADSVYDIVFSRLDPSIEGIVDASKSHNKWANRFLHDETYDKYYIHLIRDPRAMLRRWKLTAHFRKNLRMKRRLKSYNHEWARQLRFARQNTTLTYRWIMENRQIDGFLTSNHLNHRLVTYHDAAKNPEEVVGSLMDWLEIPFEPEQLEYWKFHHVGTQKKAYSLRHRILLSIEHPIGLIVATGFWYAMTHFLSLEGLVLTILLALIKVSFSAGLIWAAYNLVEVFSSYIEALTEKTETDLDDHLVPFLKKTLRVFVILFGTLLAIQNLGVNVMSLLAGLGLGGLAFALAARDTAANLFGSIMLITDRPFKIGDWIKANDTEGTVEEVGFRSTQVRTFYNSLVSIPNSILANVKIDNMGARKYRRVYTTLGLTYNTPPDKLQEFINGVNKIIESNPNTWEGMHQVVFSGYGDFSLDVMVYFYLDVDDWFQEMQERQKIFFEILALAPKVGVEFAFPTQTLHVESLPEPFSANT